MRALSESVMSLTRRTTFFGAYCLCLALAHASVLRALYDYSRENVSASHVVAIPIVSAVLIFQKRVSIFSKVRTSWFVGLAIVLFGAGLAIAARLFWNAAEPADLLPWTVGAFVVLLVGGFVLLYGWDASEAALFPLCFLVFTVPIPEAVLNGATHLLKQGSTEAVAALFALTGTVYHREGFVFTLPNLVIEIADECSGIRSSIALLLTGLLASHSLLNNPWAKVVLLVAILPVALLKNSIRIVSLSLLAIHVDPSFLTGQLHHEGGVVFFLFSLGLLAPLFALLHRWERAFPSGSRV